MFRGIPLILLGYYYHYELLRTTTTTTTTTVIITDNKKDTDFSLNRRSHRTVPKCNKSNPHRLTTEPTRTARHNKQHCLSLSSRSATQNARMSAAPFPTRGPNPGVQMCPGGPNTGVRGQKRVRHHYLVGGLVVGGLVCRLYLLRSRSLYTHSTVCIRSLGAKLGALSISKLRRRARATRHGPSRTRRSTAEAIVALFADPLEDPLRSVHQASRR